MVTTAVIKEINKKRHDKEIKNQQYGEINGIAYPSF